MKVSPQNAPEHVDDYIAGFPVEIQKVLQEFRSIIRKAAPEAQEKIGYQMPAFYLEGPLVYFAAWKKHIGFYAIPTGIAMFKDELSSFETSKGTVKFPIDKPLPVDLITRMVKYRVKENLMKAAEKKLKRRS